MMENSLDPGYVVEPVLRDELQSMEHLRRMQRKKEGTNNEKNQG
jgi:hypothetical protein